MHRFKVYVTVLTFLLFAIPQSQGQAWTKKKGSTYSQLGFSSIVASSKFSNNTEFINLPRKVTDRTFQLYHEHGLTDKLMLIANVPLKDVSTGEDYLIPLSPDGNLPSGNLLGLGNINLAMVYGIKQKGSLVYAVQLATTLNTAKESSSKGLRTGYDAWGVSPSFHLGYGTKKYWSSFDIGINLRSNNFSHQYFTNAQLGTKIKGHFHIIGNIGALQSMQNGNALDGNSAQTALYNNDVEFVTFGLKLGYEFKNKMTIWGSFGGAFSGGDVLAAPAYSVAISYKRDKKVKK